MKRIDPKDWVPMDGLRLEDNALTAVRAAGYNTLVVAGPGSGKTELLAQKACYLLQTQACPYPRRILAISFKRDSAYNLKDRVIRRCGEVLSQRFDSFTFDAFSKRLLDRFRSGLPDPYQLADNYELLVKAKICKDEIENAFRAVDATYFHTHSFKYAEYITSKGLPHATHTKDMEVLKGAWLYLTSGAKPKVTFDMIMRLTNYILITNPLVRTYLQQTYSHVFLDEFQDTTYLQYEFLKCCFSKSKVNYTAVGDDKQTIMGWAGAIPNIFTVYKQEANATRLPLVSNFRSAPNLVRLQNYLVKELLGKSEEAECRPDWDKGPGEAKICLFDNEAKETQYLVSQIQHWLHKEKIPPREICVLVKQLPVNYTTELLDLLSKKGIPARDEIIFQDLLTEVAVQFVMNMLVAIFQGNKGEESQAAFEFLCIINGNMDDSSLLELKQQFLAFCRQTAKRYRGVDFDLALIKELIKNIIEFAGANKIKATYPQYEQGAWLRDNILNLCTHLHAYYKSTENWVAAIDALLGKDAIPIMNTHKSKGLEYHTMVFIGLEDGAFWTYNTQPESDNNLFFVALSRAKERVLFTFSTQRSYDDRPQTATRIARIHQLLMKSPEVETVDQRTIK